MTQVKYSVFKVPSPSRRPLNTRPIWYQSREHIAENQVSRVLGIKHSAVFAGTASRISTTRMWRLWPSFLPAVARYTHANAAAIAPAVKERPRQLLSVPGIWRYYRLRHRKRNLKRKAENVKLRKLFALVFRFTLSLLSCHGDSYEGFALSRR
jgi:hypothetical protein